MATLVDLVNSYPQDKINHIIAHRPFTIRVLGSYYVLCDSLGASGEEPAPFTWNVVDDWLNSMETKYGSFGGWLNSLGITAEPHVSCYAKSDPNYWKVNKEQVHFKRHYNVSWWSLVQIDGVDAHKQSSSEGDLNKYYKGEGLTKFNKLRKWWSGKELNEFNMLRYMIVCANIAGHDASPISGICLSVS